jgi:hypothetical protein
MGVNSSWHEGILVRNWRIAGVYIGPKANTSLLVFLDLSQNNSFGLYNAGTGINVQNSYIHDNGAYNVVKVEPQTGTSRFEMFANWIGNSNYSRSNYGMLITNPYANRTTGSLDTLLYDCIFGPALGQGLVNLGLPYGLYLTHSLFIDSTYHNFFSNSKCLVVDVTSYLTKHNINGTSHNAVNATSDSTVEGNLVYQGVVGAPAGTNWYNTGLPNYQYNTTGNTTALSKTEMSPPIFVQDAQISTYDGRVPVPTLTATDFTISSKSAAAGSGPDSNATSVNNLLQFLLPRGEGPP